MIRAHFRRAKAPERPATNHICITIAPAQKRRRGGRRGRDCGREIFEGVGTAGAKGGRRGRDCGREIFEGVGTAGAKVIVYILPSRRRPKSPKRSATNLVRNGRADTKRRRGGRRGRDCGREIFEEICTAGAQAIVYILASLRRAKLAKGSVRSPHPAHRRAAQKKRSALRRPSLPLSNLLILS